MKLEYCTLDTCNDDNFYKIPKLLLSQPEFLSISFEARMLYSFLLDRVTLSQKNNWVDEKNHVYIYFTIQEAMKLTGYCKNKILKLFSQLDKGSGCGLIERKRKFSCKPNIIYVMNIVKTQSECSLGNEACQECQKETTEGSFFYPLEKMDDPKSLKQTTDGSIFTPSVVQKEDTIKTNITKTDITKTNSTNPTTLNTPKQETWIDVMEDNKEYIKCNIDYNELKERNPKDIETIDNIVEILTETVSSLNKSVRIGETTYSIEAVQKRIYDLTYEHILYVLILLSKNKNKIYNYKSYMISILFNAPLQMSNYYDSLLQESC